MGNWLSHLKAPAAAAGLSLLLLAGVAGLTATSAGAEEKKPQLSSDVVAKLKPAQDALLKGDYDAGLALARDGLAIAKKPYDRETALRMILSALGNKKDFPNYAVALEQLNEIETVPAEDKKKSYKTLAQIYGQTAVYDKAAMYATKWAETGGGAEAYDLLSTIYLIQKDCKNGVAALEKAVEGREPTEQNLKQENYCYYQLGEKAKRQVVMETLFAKYPKHDYFSDLMLIYQEQNIETRARFNLYRYAFERDFLTRESEFVEFADDAINVGAPAEALKVLESGISKGAVKLVAATDRNSKMLALAKAQTAEDRKIIGQLDKEARAGKNGEADVKVGVAYLGLGEYDKAVEAVERGLSADRIGKVKRVDDARMTLGIAYVKLGKKAEAAKAFTAAKEDPAMAKAATVWLQATL
jgi:Tetratricopeptide repeat